MQDRICRILVSKFKLVFHEGPAPLIKCIWEIYLIRSTKVGFNPWGFSNLVFTKNIQVFIFMKHGFKGRRFLEVLIIIIIFKLIQMCKGIEKHGIISYYAWSIFFDAMFYPYMSKLINYKVSSHVKGSTTPKINISSSTRIPYQFHAKICG